jgi:hypothetical protein
MSGKQICQMKHIDRDELEIYCREHQLRMPGWDAPTGNQLSGVFDVQEETKDEAKAAALKQPKSAGQEDRLVKEQAKDDDRPASVIAGATEADEEDVADNRRASVLHGSEESEPPPEAANAVEGELTPEAQVVLYHKAGLKPDEIAADMGTTDPTMDLARVRKIIRQFTRNPATIPLPADAVV